MRQLNARFLLVLIVSVTLLSGGLFGLHRAQSGRIARALLHQAERAEDQGQRDQQVKYLSRYLEFVPDDNEVRAELGQILASPEAPASARARERAAFVLEQVLLREPNRHDSRRLLVRVAFQLGRLDLANAHLEALEKHFPKDGEVLRFRGQWHEAQTNERERGDHLRKAVARYGEAIGHAPKEIDCHVRLAYLLRQRPELENKDPKKELTADGVMERLVANNADSFRAYLARWQYRRSASGQMKPEDLARAGEDVAQALKLAPDEAAVIKAGAELAQLQGKPDEARQQLERGLKLHPADAFLHQELARLELQHKERPVEKSREVAIDLLRKGVRAVAPGQGQNDLTWTLANLLLDDGRLTEAEAAIGQLRKARFSSAGADFLAARLAAKKNQWVEAARLVERARPLFGGDTELARQADVLLVQCYERLDEPAGRRLPVYQRLIQRDPNSASARQVMAASLFAMGRLDEALEQYQQLAALPDAPPNAWVQVARLLMLRNRQRERPDWREVEQALAKADPAALETALLRCELLYAQRRPDEARKLLEERRDRDPKQVEWWAALAVLAERQQQPEEAHRLLTEAGKQCGDSVEMRLAWARYWAARRGDEAKKAVVKLAEKPNSFSTDDQARLLLGLVEAQCRLGDFPEAERLWGRLARQERFVGDLRVQQLWFDLALQAGAEDAQKASLAAIRKLEEGEGPLWHYGEAVRLIRLARRGQKDGLDEARKHLDAAASRRPSWPAVQVARAQVEEIRGNIEQAIEGYRRAIQLGERGPQVTRELVQLLHSQRRFTEADQEIRNLGRQIEQSPELTRLAADISLQNQDSAQAVRLALTAVSRDSTDYRDFLWVGQVQAVNGPVSAKEASANLQRAVELAPEVGETWVTWVRYLAATGRTEEAEEAIKQAEAKLPAREAPLVLGQCNEAISKFDLAKKYYEAALAARPNEVVVLRTVAAFHLRFGRLREAEPLLRSLIDRKVEAAATDVTWARHSLALGLANFADYRRFSEALGVLGLRLVDEVRVVEEKKPAEGEFAEEQRARVRVLVTANRRPLRQEAIRLLNELSRRLLLTADDRFLLAQLHEANGEWARAGEELQTLVAAPGANALTLAHAARSYLRRGQTTEAERCVKRLEQMEKARGVEAGTFGSVELDAQLRTPAEAVTLLRDYAKREGASPEDALLLAGCLARHNRVGEALDVCEKAWASCSPEAAGGASVAVLRTGRAGPDEHVRVERMLKAALDKHAGNPMLLLHLADVCDLQAKYKEAAGYYRQVLTRDEGNVVALNNLAYLLAQESKTAAEGLTLINRAIQLVGPRAELLDTRALVQLALGRPDQAIADLKRLNQETPSGQREFHLARAHLSANDPKAAGEALGRVKDKELLKNQLHPIERPVLEKMLAELKRR